MHIIPARVLVEQQDRYLHPRSIADNLGDGYLYANSDFYRLIRDTALDLGFRFVERESETWSDYLVMPLLALASILEKKEIPYVDNVSFLRKLYAQKPDLLVSLRLLYGSLRRNYTFHESCHCVARHLDCIGRYTSEQFATPEQAFIGRSLIEEAFANSVERIASISGKSASLIFFSDMNSYLIYRSSMKDHWDRLTEELGLERLLTFLLMNYVYLNFAPGKEDVHTENVMQYVVPLLGLDGLESVIREILKSELAISIGFLEETTSGYFHLLGYEAALQELRGSERIKEDSFSRSILQLCEELASWMVTGIAQRTEQYQLVS
jgi:hypothetical protein